MNSYIVTKTSNQRTAIDNNSSYKKDKENSIFFHLHLGKNLII
jgi:N-acetylmuramoyl-L-alanine amidase CwlA